MMERNVPSLLLPPRSYASHLDLAQSHYEGEIPQNQPEASRLPWIEHVLPSSAPMLLHLTSVMIYPDKRCEESGPKVCFS